MPFTLAHPAITLPFTRSRFISTTAIVIGSMIPDVEYFITMGEDCHNAHTWQTALYAYLPLTFLLAHLFHTFVRRYLVRNLPLAVQQRVGAVTNFNFWKSLRQKPFVFLASAILGIGSHFLWDSLTHRHTLITEHFDAFYNTTLAFNGSAHGMYIYLQYMSSAFGLCMVAGHMVSFRASVRGVINRPEIAYWLAVFTMIAGILVARFAVDSDGLNVREWIISFTTAAFVSLTITGMFIRYGKKVVEMISRWASVDQIHAVLQHEILPLQEKVLSMPLPALTGTRRLRVEPVAGGRV